MFRYKLPLFLLACGSTLCSCMLVGPATGTASAQTEFASAAPGLASASQPLLLEIPLADSAEQPDASANGSPRHPKPALGSFTLGWTTLYADEGAGEREDINGPFFRPSFNIPKGFSVFFDSTNYYGRNRNGSLNGHGFTFGAGHDLFDTKHVKPAFFAEAGVVRTSNAGSIVDQFAFASGLSFTIPLNRHVDLALTPAEWVFLYPKGDPRNDYNAKVGLSFPFGHR